MEDAIQTVFLQSITRKAAAHLNNLTAQTLFDWKLLACPPMEQRGHLLAGGWAARSSRSLRASETPPCGPSGSPQLLAGLVTSEALSARLVCVPIFGRHFRVHQLTSFVVGCFEKED